jgi:hypothetical protein
MYKIVRNRALGSDYSFETQPNEPRTARNPAPRRYFKPTCPCARLIRCQYCGLKRTKDSEFRNDSITTSNVAAGIAHAAALGIFHSAMNLK